MVEALCTGKKSLTRRLNFKGSVGDIIWAKENYYQWGYWITETMGAEGEHKIKQTFIPDNFVPYPILYEAPEVVLHRSIALSSMKGYYKRSALFMPKSASRLSLEVTEVRDENLIDISDEDCLLEGIIRKNSSTRNDNFKNYTLCYNYLWDGKSDDKWFVHPRQSFFSLWKLINGEDSLSNNPKVKVVCFKQIKP